MFEQFKKHSASEYLRILILIPLLYVAISVGAFAFRYPELTTTQRTLRIVDALLWR